MTNQFDHRNPYPGDHGKQYERTTGPDTAYPEYLFGPERATPYQGRFDDGPWSVTWGIYPDEPDPMLLSLEHPDSLDDWAAITISLTVERAMLLKLAIERALAELEKR